jgi:hypothetical protein
VSIADSTDFSPLTPNALAEKYGEDECFLVDCKTGKHCAKATTMGAFYKDFSKCFTHSIKKAQSEETADSIDDSLTCQQDWPPTENFPIKCEELYTSFCSMLPVPHCIAPDGVLSIAAYMPLNAVPPDLGTYSFLNLPSM